MTGVVGHESSNRDVQVIIGVDTHQDQHVAVAIDQRGVRLDEKHVPVATCGYEELEQWSRNLGQVWSTTVILAAPVASTEYVTVIFPASN